MSQILSIILLNLPVDIEVGTVVAVPSEFDEVATEGVVVQGLLFGLLNENLYFQTKKNKLVSFASAKVHSAIVHSFIKFIIWQYNLGWEQSRIGPMVSGEKRNSISNFEHFWKSILNPDFGSSQTEIRK